VNNKKKNNRRPMGRKLGTLIFTFIKINIPYITELRFQINIQKIDDNNNVDNFNLFVYT